MKCGFCGYEFDPADAESACAGCPLVGDCHLIRCPRCGYEMPPEAKLVGWLRRLRQRQRSEDRSTLITRSLHR
jgi:hypothetical protein